MGSNLYVLTQDMMILQDMLTDPEANEQAVKDTLEAIMLEFNDKAEGYCMVMRNIEADLEAHKKEAERHAKIAEQDKKAIERLKNTLKSAMEATGQNKVNAGLFKVSIAGNGGKQPLVIKGDVPEQFKVVKYENDNEKIREYLEGLDNPEACPWAALAERGTHLNIK